MVLVTGATGFVGAYVVKELVQSGVPVRALRRTNKVPHFIDSHILDKAEWVTGDVLDLASLEDAMQGVEMVIHSAAIVSFRKNDRELIYKTNIEGTSNVVNTAIDNNIRRFIHVSSVAAIGRRTDGGKVDESAKWESHSAHTHYARSKYHAEMEVWRGFAEGLKGAIVNPSTVLGFGDWSNSSSAIFKTVFNQFPFYTKGLTGFVSVEDVARTSIMLLNSEIHSERYIINSDNWSFQNLSNAIATSFKKNKPRFYASPAITALAWRLEKVKSIFSGSRPLLTSETAKIAHSRTLFDNSKFLKVFPGFNYDPLDSVIEKACEKYLTSGAYQ
jgi:dihydroflavonol-4-reductase